MLAAGLAESPYMLLFRPFRARSSLTLLRSQELERLAAEVRARDSTLAETRAALAAERRQTDELERQLLMQARHARVVSRCCLQGSYQQWHAEIAPFKDLMFQL